MAEKILPVTRRANVGLVVNDYLDMAGDLGAEFCHLGQEDFFDAGHKSVIELSELGACRMRIGLINAFAGTGKARAGRGRGLPCHRAGLCDRHKADGETSDAGICPLGGCQGERPVVRHRRHQSGKSQRGAGGGCATHLRRIGHFERAGREPGLHGISPPIGIGTQPGWRCGFPGRGLCP